MSSAPRRRRFENAPSEAEKKQRKRKNKFILEKSDVCEKYPVILPTNLTKNQVDAYVLFLRLEEINQKLKTKELPPERVRSPSPEPVFDSNGSRINTREERYRIKLEKERRLLIENAINTHPDFGQDRKGKCVDKLFIPQDDYPEINFIGLLIGPGGSTLKEMEAVSQTKISIRGKGSHKDGKSRPQEDDNEDLHCHISADSEDRVAKAVKMVERIIESAASTGDSELKKMQLRKLAILNGSVNDADDQKMCSNCGKPGHERFDCSEKKNVTSSLACALCGGIGHLARDCIHRDNPEYIRRSQQLDQEYRTLMTEVGAGSGIPVSGSSKNPASDAPWHQTAALPFTSADYGYQDGYYGDYNNYYGGGYENYYQGQ